MTATQVTIPVTVTSGVININFKSGAADMPRLAALEVLLTSRITKVSLPAIADSYVRGENFADINYGSADSLFLKSGKSKARAYLKFSLDGLSQITSAKLRIYGSCKCVVYSSGVTVLGMDDDSWTENGITWNNAPIAVTGNYGFRIVSKNPDFYELNVTDFIRQQVSGDKVASLLLEWNSNNRTYFNSRENSLNPPQLLINTDDPLNSNTRINQESESLISSFEAKQEKSIIYPNPVQRQFSIVFSEQHTGDISLNLINQQGRSMHVGKIKASIAKLKTAIDISNLAISKGIHMLEIQSETGTEVVKLLIAE